MAAENSPSNALISEPEVLSRLKTEFLAGINHELRTPLAGIVAMADLLMETGLDEAQRQYVGAARTCALEALDHVASLLELALAAAGQLRLDEADFELLDVLHTTVAAMEPQARAKGVHLYMTLDGQLPGVVSGDAVRLHHILGYLLGNSVKFTPDGEIELRACCTALGPGQMRLDVSVRDTGIGLPPGKLQSLFKSFSQGQSGLARRYSGLGLGLALVQELVRLMGGEVAAENAPVRGTIFSFWIPLRLPVG